jgi:tetratricopeptide (TPR) repeat protein
VRQAWQLAVAQGDIDLMRQSLAGLTNFYYLRGLFEEGLQTLTATIQGMKAAQPPQPRLMGHLYLKKAQLFGGSTQLEAAIEAAQTALALGEAIDSKRLIAASHLWWGRALWRQGHYQAAKEHLQESLEHAKNRLPDLEALAWRTLSNIYFEHGDYGQDQFYATKALQSYRQQRNYREESITLNNLGHVLMALGDYTASQQHFEEVLTIQRELGSPLDEAMALEALGDLHYLLEDYALAQEYLQSALEIYKRANDREGIGYTFTHLGDVAFALQQLAQAKIWHTQAQSVRETTGQLHLMSQNESALAEIALQEGQLEVAMQYTESTLQRLEGKPCLLEAYLRCYHVLQAAQDTRAVQLLQTAYEHLHTQAQKISTTAERQRFLNNVPLHRQFLQLFKEHNMPLMLDEQA